MSEVAASLGNNHIMSPSPTNASAAAFIPSSHVQPAATSPASTSPPPNGAELHGGAGSGGVVARPSPSDVLGLLRAQLEFYFSAANLDVDVYLQSKMDAQGYVPVSLVAGFKRVLLITDDASLIPKALNQSLVCGLDANSTSIRSLVWKRPVRNTVILREVSETATDADVKGIFDKGSFTVVSARQEIPGTWSVQLATEDEAKLAALVLGNKEILGRPVKIRVKSENVLRPVAQAWIPPAAPVGGASGVMRQGSPPAGVSMGAVSAGASFVPGGLPAGVSARGGAVGQAQGYVPNAFGQWPGGIHPAVVMPSQQKAMGGQQASLSSSGSRNQRAGMTTAIGAVPNGVTGSTARGGVRKSGAKGEGEASTSKRRGGKSASSSESRGTSAAATATKGPNFGSHDFPSLSSAVAVAPPAAAVVPPPVAAAAPAPPAAAAASSTMTAAERETSWAAVLRSTPSASPLPSESPVSGSARTEDQDVAAAAQQSPPPAEEAPKKEAEASSPASESTSATVPDAAASPPRTEAPTESAASSEAAQQQAAAQQQNAERRRGWEQPGLPIVVAKPKPAPPPPTAEAAAAPSSESAPSKEAKRDKSSKREGRSEGKRAAAPSASASPVAASTPAPAAAPAASPAGSAAPAAVAPGSWGQKSFAQVLKEKEAQPNVAATTKSSTSTVVPLTSEKLMATTMSSWSDMADFEEPARPSTSSYGASAADASKSVAAKVPEPEVEQSLGAETRDWRKSRRKVPGAPENKPIVR